MARDTKYQVLTADGATTYSQSGTVRYKLSQLQPINRIRNGVTYLRSLQCALKIVINKSDAGATSLNEEKARDVIDRILVKVQGWIEPIYDLSGGAGSALGAFHHATHGRRAHGKGDITVAAAGDSTYYLFFDLPLRLVGGADPDDANVPIRLLRDGTVELTWADGSDGSLFAATVGIEATATVDRVVAELIERDEFYFPTRFSVQNQELTSADVELPIQGRTLHALLAVPVHAAGGLSSNTITNAELTLVTLSGDGRTLRDRVNAADLMERWNAGWAQGRDESLSAHEETAAAFVPLFVPDRTGYPITQLPHFTQAPNLKHTGSDTTQRVVYMTSRPTTPGEVVAALQAAGIRPRGMTGANAKRFLYLRNADGSRRAWPRRFRGSRIPVGVSASFVA